MTEKWTEGREPKKNNGIYVQKSTILELGIKEYLRIFYSSFFVRKMSILLLYLSRRRKNLERRDIIYIIFFFNMRRIFFLFSFLPFKNGKRK